MFTNNQWRWKCVISAFVISQPIKKIIANRHDKLNRFMIAQSTQLFSDKNGKNWLMNVEDIASQISVIFGIQHDWRDQISGVHIFLGSAKTLARGDEITKSPFNSVLSQQHLYQKLLKSVNMRWSSSVLHQCRFLRHSVNVFHKYSLGGDTTAPSGLYARLCHAFLVSAIFNILVHTNNQVLFWGDLPRLF